MKRTVRKVDAEDPKTKDTDLIHWKKEGGGSLRIGRRIIKPGEKFWATEKEISAGFRDVVKPIDGLPPAKKQEPIPGVKPNFKLKPREDVKGNFKLKPRKGEEDTYDVVSVVTTIKDGEKQEKEKALNAKPLTKVKAEKLLNALLG